MSETHQTQPSAKDTSTAPSDAGPKRKRTAAQSEYTESAQDNETLQNFEDELNRLTAKRGKNVTFNAIDEKNLENIELWYNGPYKVQYSADERKMIDAKFADIRRVQFGSE